MNLHPSLNPAVFLDAAKALSVPGRGHRDGYTYCCPQLNHSAHEMGCLEGEDAPERDFFQELFDVGNNTFYAFEHMWDHYYHETLTDQDSRMEELRVMALCFTAAIVESGGLD